MIGEIVSKYTLLEELGRGSMGTVYKAMDRFVGRFVALKLLAGEYLHDREILVRFEREAFAMGALAHPNICTVFDAGEHQGRPYIAMELLEGVTLTEQIDAKVLGLKEVLEIAVAVASALEAAHSRDIIHRDIKPANLFITRRRQVKVLDFGLAKMRRRPRKINISDVEAPTGRITFVTSPGTVLGTWAYMSPEQARGQDVDGRADLYSLGAVLYEAATGLLPMGDLRMEALPAALVPVVAKAMARDVNARYQSATELRRALERLSALPLSASAAR